MGARSASLLREQNAISVFVLSLNTKAQPQRCVCMCAFQFGLNPCMLCSGVLCIHCYLDRGKARWPDTQPIRTDIPERYDGSPSSTCLQPAIGQTLVDGYTVRLHCAE